MGTCSDFKSSIHRVNSANLLINDKEQASEDSGATEQPPEINAETLSDSMDITPKLTLMQIGMYCIVDSYFIISRQEPTNIKSIIWIPPKIVIIN